jgi:hypothetical protein
VLRAIRLWMPVSILVAGVVLVIVRGGDETSFDGAAALWGAGLSVMLLNWLHRMGVAGDSERDDEDRAREYFDAHGRWPDDAPSR